MNIRIRIKERSGTRALRRRGGCVCLASISVAIQTHLLSIDMTDHDQDKIDRYQDVVTKATTDVWTHMLSRIDDIPETVEDLTDEQMDILMDIESVESEWILDEEMRQAVSIIQWEEDDEDEEDHEST